MTEQDLQPQEIIKLLKNLPPDKQQVFLWLVRNLDFVNELVDCEKMTTEAISKSKQHAIETNDHLLLLLLLYKEIKDSSNT